MGNEATKQALLEQLKHTDVAKLEAALRQKRSTGSRSEQARNGWNRKDVSPNLNISDDMFTIKRGPVPNQRDAARGCVAYSKNIHFFEFRWKPGENKRVVIGVATSEANLVAKGDKIVLGGDDKSVGFNLVTREIFFNGLVVKTMVKNRPDNYKVPSAVTMILNMDDGTLAFKTDTENLGTAMKGLKHLATGIYAAAELDANGDEITMKYLGGADAVAADESSIVNLCFHDVCGKNIKLEEVNHRASRKNPKGCFANATVLTNRPLKDDELFKVMLVAVDRSRWHGSWMVGVTTNSPIEFSFASDMRSCKQGNSWIMSGNKVDHKNKHVAEMSENLDDIPTGSTVGVKKRGDKLMFYVDGKKQTTITIDVKQPLYGVVDVYGEATCVTMLGEETEISPVLEHHEATAVPRTAGEYVSRLREAVDAMKTKSKETMPKVKRLVKYNLDDIYHKIKSRRLRQLAAEKLANMDAAHVFTEYIQFLMKQDPENNSLVAEIYESVLSVCWNYSDNSVLLATQMGEAGLLDMLIKYLNDNSSSYQRNKVSIISVLSCFGILHNCAKSTENKPIYRRNNYMVVSKPYCDAKTTIKEICLPAIFTKSYVFEEDEVDELQIPEPTAQDAVNTLGKAIDNEERHQHDGWHAHELTVGIGKLSANPTNLRYFVQKGAVKDLVKMLGFEDHYEQECALNTLWSLTTDYNKQEIVSTEDLTAKLEIGMTSKSDSVKQAAVRLKMKLKIFAAQDMENILCTKIGTSSECDYKELSTRYKDSLDLSEHFFDKTFDMCFCVICHGSREEQTKYTRGVPPKEYGIPVGWYRFGLKLPPRAQALHCLEKWHRAFHGTKQDYVKGILEVGELVPADRAVLGGKKIQEQPGHYNDEAKPDGFNTKQLFLSPSIRYSGVDAYATPSSYTDTKSKKKHTTKIAFQVLIQSDSYEVGPETIGASSEIDPGFSNQELEWSTEQHGSTILYGLLVKLE